MLITMMNGFNLLSKSNVLSFCCQNPAQVPTRSLLPLQVPTQVLAAFPLVAQHPLSPGTCLAITMPAWGLPAAPWC